MRAAIINAPRELELSQLPDPKIDGKEVLIQVDSCGICGSDVKIYKGEWTISLSPRHRARIFGESR